MADEQPADNRTETPWPGWTGVRRGPDHTDHADHQARERDDS